MGPLVPTERLYTGRGMTPDTSQFKAVPVQVDRVDVVSRVLRAQTDALAPSNLPGNGHRIQIKGRALDRPVIEAAVRRVIFGEEIMSMTRSGVDTRRRGSTP
jgi:hypothetical protein